MKRSLKYPVQRPLKLPTKPARARAESKALWNEARSSDGADFFTVGYEGRTTKDLFSALLAANVQCVVDIRYNPVSMYRPELSKGNLQSALLDCGIAYFHLREWGVPRDIRAKAVESGTRETIWQWYDECVVGAHFRRNLHRFLNFGYPVAMLCMECDPTECHRHRIFMALENQGLRGFDL
jgi:uncharacterized protein (DUF488 family)